MTVIQGVVVTGLLFGAHYICHQGAAGGTCKLQGRRSDGHSPSAGLETPISSVGNRWKKEWPQKRSKKEPRGAASHIRSQNASACFNQAAFHSAVTEETSPQTRRRGTGVTWFNRNQLKFSVLICRFQIQTNDDWINKQTGERLWGNEAVTVSGTRPDIDRNH